jgi:simple sugar transport system permease protein
MTAPTVENQSGGQEPVERQETTQSRWRIEPRVYVSKYWQFGAIIFALLGSLAVSAVLIALAGANVSEGLIAMIDGGFGGGKAIAETLVQATPLIFTGLAVVVAFRARIWNIGVEGQFFAGAMGAVWITMLVGESLPSVLLISLIIIVAIICGAIWGAIPGFLKVRYGANEIIVTVMMNFIILFVLSFLLSEAWRDPNSFFYQTVVMPKAAHFPRLVPRTRLHLGFVLALFVAGLVYILLWKSTLGYEIRALGINPLAVRYKGISVARITILVMAISGAIAGLGGASEVPGLQQRLRLDISTGFGFTGIIIAMLGRLHPMGVILAAIFFGALVTGASTMQIAVNVPVAIAQAIQGVTLIFLLIADVLSRYRIRRVGTHD